MFNKEQIDLLNQELASNRIKSRDKGNIKLSYLEGFNIIDTANKIFGYGNWGHTISKLEFVSQEQNQKQNTVICYRAIVTLTVNNKDHTNHISKDDVGYGTGVSKSLADAHEGAGKEAVTDAIKRCLRTFGNQFGNSLYDKSRNQTNSNQQQQQYHPPQNNTNQNQQQYHPQNQQSNNYPQNNPQNQPMQNNTQNNYPQNNQHQQPIQNNTQQHPYETLINLGLQVVDNGNGSLIVVGENIYPNRDAIKSYGFRWDGKFWHKPIEQQVA